MNKSLLTLTASAFILASTMGVAQAQSTGDTTMQQGQTMQGQQGERMKQGRDGKKKYGRHHRDRRYGMRHHRRGGMHHGRGMGRGGGMGGMGGMGHRGMMQVVFAMMDADGNGTLSLQEVQDAHARIFAHMDSNDDDQVTKEEIKAFFHGGKDRSRAGKRDNRSGAMDDTDAMQDTDAMDDTDAMEGTDAMDDTDATDDDLNLSDDVDGGDNNGDDN